MPLKKPSEFYDKNPNSSFDDVKEELKKAKPEKVEKISEAFDSFKNNLNNIQTLNDFVESVDTFKANAERVESLSESVEKIRESIKDLTSKKDLDDAMMAHLLFVEESIRDVQDKVKNINSKSVLELREEFDSISGIVNSFISEEVPSYKKLIVDSETRIDDRFVGFKEDVKTSLEDLETGINNDVSKIAANLEGINEGNLSGIKEDVRGIGEKVKILLEKELPEYKKFFAETELKVEDRIGESEKRVEESLKGVSESIDASYKENLEGIEKGFEKVAENYRKNLVESKLKAEKEIKKVTGLLAEDVLSLDNRIDEITEGVISLQSDIDQKDGIVKNILNEQIVKIEKVVKESKTLANNFKRDFVNREIESDKKLGDYLTELESFSRRVTDVENHLSDNICDIQENLDASTSTFHNELKSEVDLFQEEFNKKVKDLQLDFNVNEKHIEKLTNDWQHVVETIDVDDLVRRVTQINEENLFGVKSDLEKQVQNLQENVGKFQEENKLLQEGLLNIPPDVKNSDPLTPLNQEYVTLKQLQDHYRIFVNRVQQQISTLGGGGEVFLARMQDVAVGAGIQTNNWVLSWDTDQSLFVPSAGGTGAGGTWGSDSVGVYTGRNVGLGTTARSDYQLYVSTGSTTDTVAYFDGSISVGGTSYSREVVDIESIGIITATKGIDVLAGGIEVDAGGISVSGVTTAQQNLDVITGGIKVLAGGITVNAGVTTVTDVEADSLTVSVGLATVKDLKVGAASTFVGVGTFQDDLFVGGDLSVVGILTVGSSSITIDGSTNKVNVGTAITLDATAGTIEAYNGTAERTTKLVNPSGDADFVGIVTASSFVVGVGGTDLLSEITGKTSIGLVLALS